MHRKVSNKNFVNLPFFFKRQYLQVSLKVPVQNSVFFSLHFLFRKLKTQKIKCTIGIFKAVFLYKNDFVHFS